MLVIIFAFYFLVKGGTLVPKSRADNKILSHSPYISDWCSVYVQIFLNGKLLNFCLYLVKSCAISWEKSQLATAEHSTTWVFNNLSTIITNIWKSNSNHNYFLYCNKSTEAINLILFYFFKSKNSKSSCNCTMTEI